MSHQPTLEFEIPSIIWFATSVNWNQVLQENKLLFIVWLSLRANNNRHEFYF